MEKSGLRKLIPGTLNLLAENCGKRVSSKEMPC